MSKCYIFHSIFKNMIKGVIMEYRVKLHRMNCILYFASQYFTALPEWTFLGMGFTPDKRQSKTLVLSTNVDQK